MNLLQWSNNLINDGIEYISFLVSPAMGNAPTTPNRANRDGFFPSVETVSRLPKIIMIDTIIQSATPEDARLNLRHYFETESGETKTLIAVNDTGITVGVDCICVGHLEQDNSPLVFRSFLETQSDPYWLEIAENASANNITASGQQFVINIDSDQIIRPTYELTPRQPKINDNAFKQFIAIRWFGRQALEYQTDITDGLLDTQIASTNFVSATGDDIRVLLNGVFHDYWLNGINTATTSIWTYLDFAEGVNLTLFGNLPASGTIESIDFNEDISRLPNSGIILINSEIFTYSGKNDAIRRIFIENRADKDTVEAAHNSGDDCYWIQHDIELQYGDSSLTAYPSDPAKEPLINFATSTNLQHDYQVFGDRLGTRPGNWARTPGNQDRTSFINTPYSETEYPGFPIAEPLPTDPFNVLGGYIRRSITGVNTDVIWTYESPLTITNAQFLNGKKRKSLSISGIDDSWRGSATLAYDTFGGSGTIIQHLEQLPLSNDSFQSWSFSGVPAANAYRYFFSHAITGVAASLNNTFYELGQVIFDFDNTLTPKPFLAPEAGNYTIFGSLTHLELNKSILVNHTLGLNDTLVIDTEEATVKRVSDNSSHFQALTIIPPSQNILPLRKGTNTFQWDELDIVEMDLDVKYKRRYGA